MRRNSFFYFSIYLFFIFPVFAEQLKVQIQAEAGILMNADTGAILFEKNPYQLHYPASTTKVATGLYFLKFHSNKLDELVLATQESLGTLSQDAKRQSNYSSPAYLLEPDGSHIGIKNEEEIAFIDLLKGMLIPSGNDAANVIAQASEGSIPEFMKKLNSFLKDIGCKNTTFYNPHGLHHPDHKTTAYDLALITKEALKDPLFCEIVSQTRFVRPKTNKQKSSVALQTNRLLRKGNCYYSKAIGVKTGYHAKAQKTFIGAAKSNGRTLIVVLLKNDNRNQMFLEAIKLFETAFNQPKVRHTLLKQGKQKFTQFLPHAKGPLETCLKRDLSIEYYPAEDPKAKCLLHWNQLTLPIYKGQQVGTLELIAENGAEILNEPLYALENVSLKWPYNWLSKIKHTYNQNPMLIWAFFVVLIGSVVGAIWLVLKTRLNKSR